jgi:hypothetical protein
VNVHADRPTMTMSCPRYRLEPVTHHLTSGDYQIARSSGR